MYNLTISDKGLLEPIVMKVTRWVLRREGGGDSSDLSDGWFNDTCYLLSLINVMEKNHDKAVKLLEYIDEEETLINSTVLLEMLNRLKKKRYEKYRDTIINLIYNIDNIHYLTPEDYNNSLNTCKYYDFNINFSDCTIIESMKRFNVTHIVSFDSDFDKANDIKRIYL